MKIKEITLQNYKRFVDPKPFSFCDEEGVVNDITLLVGSNGSGKTTILQAIAATLGTATKELKRPSQLTWSGLNWKLITKNGNAPQVDLKMSFTEQELSSVAYLHQQLKERGQKSIGNIPIRTNEVMLKLRFESEDYKVETDNPKALNLFWGYSYVKTLLGLSSGASKKYFDQVGNVFWYKADRNNNSFRSFLPSKSKTEIIREFLISRYRFHQDILLENRTLKDDQRDIFADLASMYHKLFPTRELYRTEPRESLYESYQPDWFFLRDGENKYEISEMSAGEEAIFPILIDFANLKINNSIILIDEIDLHLHPPLQQAFVDALPKLGKNNQFIITTHSEEVASMFRRNQIKYLK